MPNQDMKIPKGDVANFETIKKAHRDGNLELVSAIRKSDGKRVSLVCALGSDGNIIPSSLAIMIEGELFELFEDPFAG